TGDRVRLDGVGGDGGAADHVHDRRQPFGQVGGQQVGHPDHRPIMSSSSFPTPMKSCTAAPVGSASRAASRANVSGDATCSSTVSPAATALLYARSCAW